MSLSWKSEGRKTIIFRADYRRPVNEIYTEYRTVHIDVVFVKTDLLLEYVHLSPATPNGHQYQRFIVQTLGLFCSSLTKSHRKRCLFRCYSNKLYNRLW